MAEMCFGRPLLSGEFADGGLDHPASVSSVVSAAGKAEEAGEGLGEPNVGPTQVHPRGGRSEIPTVLHGESVASHEKWADV